MCMVSVATLNVRGIKQPLKRVAVFLSLHSVSFDLIFFVRASLMFRKGRGSIFEGVGLGAFCLGGWGGKGGWGGYII